MYDIILKFGRHIELNVCHIYVCRSIRMSAWTNHTLLEKYRTSICTCLCSVNINDTRMQLDILQQGLCTLKRQFRDYAQLFVLSPEVKDHVNHSKDKINTTILFLKCMRYKPETGYTNRAICLLFVFMSIASSVNPSMRLYSPTEITQRVRII